MFEEGDIITYTRDDGTVQVGKFCRYAHNGVGIWALFQYMSFITKTTQVSLYHKEIQYNPLQQADCEDDI